MIMVECSNDMSRNDIMKEIKNYTVPMLESDMDELKERTNTTSAKDALAYAARKILEGKQ
jgi:hypothetical protein